MFKNCKVAGVIFALVIIGGPAGAQTMFTEGEFKPFDDIRVPKGELQKSVGNRVLYFAHFTCPFCRNAHSYLHEWGDALPTPYRLEVVPAVALPEHYPMAMAYYAVVQIAPNRLRDFEKSLFGELQDRHGDEMDPATYRRAASRIGISEDTFNRTITSKATAGFVRRAYELTRLYGIDEVPTVVVANRFKTSPGRVQNDKQSFIAILNGLISMHYRERAEQ